MNASELSRLGLELDEAAAERRRAGRERQVAMVDHPLHRTGGNALLLACAWLHDRYVLDTFDGGGFFALCVAVIGYSLLSTVLVRALYDREPRVADALLVFDVVVWTVVLHATGGERSWLFPVLVMRTADQAGTTLRRVTLFANFSVLCYAVMLLWAWQMDGRPLQAGASLTKLFVLWACNMYVARVAAASEALRARTRAAMAAARDLVQQVAAKSAELDAARQRAETADRAKSAFLANMSHELRTPLNAILGYTDLLIEAAQDLGHQDFVDDLRRIEESGRHLLALVQDVLDLTQLETGELQVSPQPCDARSLLEDVAVQEAPAARQNRNTLEVSGDPGLRVFADPQRTTQVLRKLVSNACKFTEDGHVWLEAAAESQGGRERVVLRVRDTGIGMSPVQVEELFQPFTQADPSATRRYGGTGIGLALALRLVKLMNGELLVDSELGRGSTFAVQLPAAAQPAAGSSAGTSPDSRRGSSDGVNWSPV